MADPGKIAGCPYAKAHIIALNIEEILARALDVNWFLYCRAIDDLIEHKGELKTFSESTNEN